MKLIHTSDWHLGRSFHGVGLLSAQAQFVDHLVETVRSESVDAVLVSGDVYDRALPPPDAVTLLSQAVTRLTDAGAQVVISSGNHDSAPRLGFASDLLARAGLHIRSDLSSIGTPVMVGECAIYPIPYLEPAASSVTEDLGVDTRTHTAVLGAAMDRVRSDARTRGPRTIAMAHCFASGGASSESERDISTLLLDLSEDGQVRVEQVPAPVHRRLVRLRGSIEEVLEDPAHDHAEDAWVQVTLTDPVRPLGALERLARRFPHVLQLRFDPQGAPVPVRSYAAKVARRRPLDVCCDFVADVRGGAAADEDERRLLEEALAAGRSARGQREDEGRAARRGVA